MLGLVPYLIGFHPEESVVALLARSGRVVLTMRVDLPALSLAPALGADIGRLIEQHRANEVILAGYSAQREPARSVLAELAATLERRRFRSRIRLHGTLLVDGRRWWSLTPDGLCSPAEGEPYEPVSHRFAAEAVYAGLSVRPHRQSLVEEVAGPPDSDREQLARLTREAAARVVQLSLAGRCELVGRLVGDGLAADVSDETCATLAVLASEIRVRDVAWSLITRERADEHARLWRRVVSRTIPPYEPAPLCLLGLSAWVSGDGALMNCCIDRVSRIDPGYSLGDLLAQISEAALPPELWDQMGAGIRAELATLAR